MSNYGAPTNLDLSGCNVTATGGSTSQTIADLAKTVANNNTDIATAVQNSTTAKTTAQAAQTTATSATTAISNLGNTYIPQTAFNNKNGVAKLDQNGQFVTPPNFSGISWINLGGYILNTDGSTAPDTNCYTIKVQQSVTANGKPTIVLNMNTWTPDGVKGYTAFSAAALHPDVNSGTSLGLADHAWNNIYSQTAVQVVSDMTQKTLIGQVGASTFAEAATLAAAVASVATIGFKLNDAIAKKGESNARIHFGYSAQDVWAAIEKAGLDPSKYGLITKTPVMVVTDTSTGETASNGTPITTRTTTTKTDSTGATVYRYLLRYEQIYALLIWYQNQKQAALEARIAALEAKAGA